MRKIVLFLAVVFLSVSCRKIGSGRFRVQYQFSSDVSATYTMEYSSDVSTLQTETFQGTTWSKTVIAKPNEAAANITGARLVAYPPSAWANTTDSAHVNLKILVNGNEKYNKNSLMTAPNGILALITW